jgi:hypothetical protein
MADETETIETPPAPAPPLWVGLLTWVAVAIVALVFLQLIGIVWQASTLGEQAPTLNFSDRLGYAFLQNLDQAPLGLELLLAVVLVLVPIILRVPTSKAQDRGAQIVLMGTVGIAFLIAIGGIIGIPARTHIIHMQKGKVTGVVRTVLFTFVMRNVGTAVLAMIAAAAAVRVRFVPRRVVVDAT